MNIYNNQYWSMDDVFTKCGNDQISEISESTTKSCATTNRPFLNRIFFNIQNEPYEIIIMWSLLIITVLLLVLLLFDSIFNEEERLRVLNS